MASPGSRPQGLEGRPQSPEKVSYRLLENPRRYRPARVVAAIAVFAAVGLLALVFYNRRRAQQQVALAAFFAQEGRSIESQMRTTYLLPEHDVTAEKAAVAERIGRLAERVAGAGRLADAPGQYALGRSYLALGDLAKARQHLERAWKAGNQEPEVAYRLGLVLGRLYQNELDQVSRVDVKSRRARAHAAQEAYRDPALDYLRKAGDVRGESPEYAAALIALFENRLDDALRLSRTAWARVNGLYEAKLLEARVHVAQAHSLEESGDNAAVLLAYTEAEHAYRDALEVGRSDAAISAGLCARGAVLLRHELYDGLQVPAPYFEDSLASCDRAIRIDPQSIDAYRSKAQLLSRRAESEVHQDHDPASWTAQTVAVAERALRLQPDDEQTLNAEGWAHAVAGLYEINHGRDPGTFLDAAATPLQRAIDVDPNLPSNHNVLGVVYRWRMLYDVDHGRDPTSSYREAVRLFLRAVDLQPDYAWGWRNLSTVYVSYADHLSSRGEDPRPILEKALTAERNAVAINRTSGMSKEHLADVYFDWAEYELAAGLDPRESYQKAEELYRESLARRPTDDIGVSVHVAHCEAALAEYAVQRSEDARPALAEGRRWAHRAMRSTPAIALPYTAAARLEVADARRLMASGASGDAALGAADRWIDKALSLDGTQSDTLMRGAEIALLRLRGGLQGTAATREAARGLDRARAALASNPNQARALALAGAIYGERAKRESGRARAEDVRKAQDALERALKLNSLLQHEFGGSLAASSH